MNAEQESPPCPSCGGRTIYVRRISRGFEPDIDVWACEPCQKIVRELVAK